MIINTGARTDTVAYYSDWLLRRFAEGFAYARNPLFPNKVTRYELDPAVVDCVEFCSKNYAPILGRLHEITERFNTHFQYTITASICRLAAPMRTGALTASTSRAA